MHGVLPTALGLGSRNSKGTRVLCVCIYKIKARRGGAVKCRCCELEVFVTSLHQMNTCRLGVQSLDAHRLSNDGLVII
eukprot:3138236-Amphidinium_carterae.1